MAETIKALDSNVKRVLDRYVLADASQIKRDMVDEDPYPLLETYENHIRDKDAGKEERPAYLRVAPEARQFLVVCFSMLVKEIRAVEDPTVLLGVSAIPVPADVRKEIEDIKDPVAQKTAMAAAADRERTKFVVEEIARNNDLCIAQFIFNLVNRTGIDNSQQLQGAFDPDNYFKVKLEAALRDKYKNNDSVVNLVCLLFDRYLKAVSFIISRFVWFHHHNINRDLILGLMYSHDLSSDLMQHVRRVMENNTEKLAAKAKPKKKTEKEVKPATAPATPEKPAADPLLDSLNALAAQQ